jgi:hypothetical protein
MDDDANGQVKTGLGYSDCRVVHLSGLIIQIVRRNPVIYLPANKKTEEADHKIKKNFYKDTYEFSDDHGYKMLGVNEKQFQMNQKSSKQEDKNASFTTTMLNPEMKTNQGRTKNSFLK